MANLIIDIGNTALKAAWTDGMTLGKTFRYQGEKMIDFILSLVSKSRPETMVLSSVRNFSSQDTALLREACDILFIVSEDVLSHYGLPLYLTPDRAASVVAARYLFKGSGCTVFDFGTTLSIDFLDSDGKYEGGFISPGCRTRFRALHRYSKSLPLLDAPDSLEAAGNDLPSSVSSGVVSGMIFEIEGHICRHRTNVNVFTGGDAIYFAKQMKNSIFVVCNLVLMGLALMAVEYDCKD